MLAELRHIFKYFLSMHDFAQHKLKESKQVTLHVDWNWAFSL